MLCYLLNITNNSVRFLILEFLEEAEDEIKEKQAFDHPQFYELNGPTLKCTKGSLKRLTECVFARCEEHQ